MKELNDTKPTHRKNHNIFVKVSSKEKSEVKHYAELERKNISEFIRDRALMINPIIVNQQETNELLQYQSKLLVQLIKVLDKQGISVKEIFKEVHHD